MLIFQENPDFALILEHWHVFQVERKEGGRWAVVGYKSDVATEFVAFDESVVIRPFTSAHHMARLWLEALLKLMAAGNARNAPIDPPEVYTLAVALAKEGR